MAESKWVTISKRARALLPGDEFWHQRYKWRVVDKEVAGNVASVYCVPSPAQFTLPPDGANALTAFLFSITERINCLVYSADRAERKAIRSGILTQP